MVTTIFDKAAKYVLHARLHSSSFLCQSDWLFADELSVFARERTKDSIRRGVYLLMNFYFRKIFASPREIAMTITESNASFPPSQIDPSKNSIPSPAFFQIYLVLLLTSVHFELNTNFYKEKMWCETVANICKYSFIVICTVSYLNLSFRDIVSQDSPDLFITFK